jgi:4-amino-4-deoxy-L-arabinose transferase-like glycosyltransferase
VRVRLRRVLKRASSWLSRPRVHATALAAVALLIGLGGAARDPLDGDPAMYGTIARTIVDSGEWTHLTFNGVPYVNKPPLHFWLNALVFRIAGASTSTAILLPGLLGVVCALLVYALTRLTLDEGWETALAAGIVYVTTPEVAHWSRGVHLETLVTAWILIGLWAAYRSVDDPRFVLVLGVASIGGWLAKGPQGLLPAAVAAALWLHAGVLQERVLSRWTLAAAALAVVTVGPWLAARLGEGSDFAHAYFQGQIADVLFNAGELRRGWLWYVGKLLRTYWPWLPVAVAGIAIMARSWRTSLGARLWLVYGAVVLVVISAAAGKKSRYLFQLYPALAAAAGLALGRWSRRFPVLPLVLVAGTVVAAVLTATIGDHVSREQRAHTAAALAIVADLPEGAPVWITHEVQYGEPQLGKIIGFYGPPLIKTCRASCEGEVPSGASVVARDHETDRVAAALGADVRARHGILALLIPH